MFVRQYLFRYVAVSGMDWKEETKLKFGQHLLMLLQDYGIRNNTKPSLRQLANRAGLEYSQVQRISTGQVDLALTTIVSLAVGLDIDPKDLLDFPHKNGLN